MSYRKGVITISVESAKDKDKKEKIDVPVAYKQVSPKLVRASVFGGNIEAFGGFQKCKDFDYEPAARAAFENLEAKVSLSYSVVK